MSKEDLTTRFLREIAKIKDPTLFIGVVRALRIALLTEEKEVKPFSQLLDEVLYKFKNELTRERKREILRILTKANQAKEDIVPQIDATAAVKVNEEVEVDASHSKDSEAGCSDSQM